MSEALTELQYEEITRLRADIANLRAANEAANGHIGEISNELAAARADVARLRDAAQMAYDYIQDDDESRWCNVGDALDALKIALVVTASLAVPDLKPALTSGAQRPD